MAKYRVIKDFADNEDRGHIYRVGDVYPRAGKEVADNRLAFLASAANLLKSPVIKRVDEPVQEVPAPVAEPVPEEVATEKPKPKRSRKKAE